MNKQELREIYRAKRRDFVREKRAEFSEKLRDSFVKAIQPKKQSIWAAYRSIGSEASSEAFVKDESLGIQWFFPVVEGTRMRFLRPKSEKSWKRNVFGIWEPEPLDSDSIEVSELDGVLVPGLAFDKWGTRLGSGLGFYDRALTGYSGQKVGLSYTVQVSEERLPRQDHDVSMDCVITEVGSFVVERE